MMECLPCTPEIMKIKKKLKTKNLPYYLTKKVIILDNFSNFFIFFSPP